MGQRPDGTGGTAAGPYGPVTGPGGLVGRVALVTGGSRGIGLAVAAVLIADGASVCVTARDPAGLAAAVRGLGPRALACPGDVADPDHLDEAVARALSAFGRLDILVNNAACGGGVGTKSFDADLDDGSPTVTVTNGQRDFPYKVSESDPEVFYLTARTKAHDVRWDLALTWSSGDRRGTVHIDNNGAPFRTSAGAGRPGYDYPLGGSEWIERPE